jgi:hypothetical protein
MITRLLLIAAPLLGFTTATGPIRPVINLLLIVFLVFGCVWLFLEIRRQLAGEFHSAPAPAPMPAPVAAAPEAIPAAVVAVIAAAVHHVFGSETRVVAIAQSRNPADPTPFPWSAEGRRSHYSSHKVR